MISAGLREKLTHHARQQEIDDRRGVRGPGLTFTQSEIGELMRLPALPASGEIADDMIRAAINAHGSSQGDCEWDWMRDALLAALRSHPQAPASDDDKAYALDWLRDQIIIIDGQIAQVGGDNPATTLLAMVAQAPASGEADAMRCTICGFVVDTRFKAEKPTAEFTMAGRGKKPSGDGLVPIYNKKWRTIVFVSPKQKAALLASPSQPASGECKHCGGRGVYESTDVKTQERVEVECLWCADRPASEEGNLREALAARCYSMSEPHLSGARLIIGFETLEAAGDAQQALSASPMDPRP